MKRAGIEDQKIMAVSGHRNVQSLEAYDRPSAFDASVAAAAISIKPTMKSACTPVVLLSNKENVPPSTCFSTSCAPGGFSVYGPSIVTIHYSSLPGYPPARPAPPRNPRSPLKLKRKSAESSACWVMIVDICKGYEYKGWYK